MVDFNKLVSHKVYGVVIHGPEGKQLRCIVAAKARTTAAKLIGVSDSHMRAFGCETGNAFEIETAMSDPGATFVRGISCFGEQPFTKHKDAP